MNSILAQTTGRANSRRLFQLGQTRISVLLAVFVAGIAAASLWFMLQNNKQQQQTHAGAGLSPATIAVLEKLDSPVEIRYYSQIDTSTVPASVQSLATRVPELLTAYEQAAHGKIKVHAFNTQANFKPAAAQADGIKAFNLSQGDACFLGITVVHNSQKEVLPRLAPEWEPALESDLTRAIARLVEPAPKIAAAVPKFDAATVETVKQAIPNLASVSVEEGKRMLRQANIADFKKAAQEMDAKLKEAQQNVLQAQTEADKQAAIQQLRALQGAQMEQLSQIAAKSQAQGDALEQLKRDGK